VKLLAMRESIMKEIHEIFSHHSDTELSRMTEVTRDIITVFEKEISHFKMSFSEPDDRRRVRKKSSALI
jgi:hypothetical protein